MQAREHWHSRIGFILAAAGSAVGLGNIWRFPYLAGEHGGGAFLLIYLMCAFTIGISALFAELAIGKATSRSPIGAFKALKAGPWTLAAYLGVCAAFLTLSFYSVVGGWTLAYVVKSVTGALGGESAESASDAFGALVSSTVEPVLYHGLFMALVVIVVVPGVRSGIEFASKWLMPILFILLLTLILRAVTLPGAAEGLEFYLRPDFSKVTATTFVAALSQAFFSLSVGLGAMITYGSYLGAGSGSLPKATTWIAGIDCGVAVLGGLLIFSAVFAFGHDPAAGPSLTFVTLPTVFHEMPGGALFATAFFALLAVAALTSAVSLLEVAVSYMVDQHGVSRRTAAIVLGIAIFIVGIPSSLSLGPWSDLTLFGLGVMDLADYVTVKLMLPIGSILLCLYAGWVVRPHLLDTTSKRDGAYPLTFRIWTVMCRFVAPIAITYILIAGLIR
ncbi:MAG: sodium-dependent transporter [Pseudomonadota bacterium]